MSSNQAPKNWKTLIKPFKSYLKAVYPSPANATPQLASRYWFLKAKKDDFNWFNGQPMPRIRADMATAIERMLKPMSIEDAIAKRKSGDTMKAKVFIRVENTAKDPQSKDAEISIASPPKKVIVQEFHISVPVNTTEDKVMFRKLMQITLNWVREMDFEQDDWIESGRPEQHRVKQFFAQYADVKKWMEANGVHWFEGTGSSTDMVWWVIPSKSRAHLRPKKASRAGPAYDHPSSNCAIEAIELAMAPVDDKQSKILSKLKDKFSTGVWPDDYSEIAKKLGRNIQITFAPSSMVAKRWVESGKKSEDQVYASFGNKTKKTIHIHHWANHATAMLQKPEHEYRYVSKDEMCQEALERYEQIYQTGESHITFRNKLDGVFETIQLAKVDGVNLDLGKTSPQSQLYDEFKKQIVPYSYNDPNRQQYDQFAKHGIHFSIGGEHSSDYDFDLKSAYSNYHKMPHYRGLPRDITYWFNNPTIEQVKANTGFVLTEFTDPIKNCKITAWLACSAIDLLHEHGLVHEMKQAAFAHSTFHLDTSKFIDHNPEVVDVGGSRPVEIHKIGKRVFHKLLGLSTQKKANKRFITADPIEVFDDHVAQMRLPACVESNNEIQDVLSNHVSIGVSYDIESERYSHVAATIQDCITTELWRKWLEVKAANPDARVITALVDGLRIRRKGFNKETFNFDDGRWVQKPTDKCFTQPQCDWVHREATMAKIAADQLTRVDWPITLKEEFENMLSVAKDDNVSFVDLVKEGYVNSLQGYAGCGKSYSIRVLLEQFNAVILTPTHSTREDMETHSIRNYIDDDQLNSIPCKTYQSVIQRKGSIRDYQVIIIDEAGMLLAEHLNRIVEMAGRKLILLVGDPAQHKPILGSKMSLEAKYLMYRDYIESNEELKELYDNGSDWERNNMLSYLQYDSTFEEPERCETDSDEEHFDKVEALRSEYVEKQREQTQKLRSLLAMTFKYETARDVPAFDTYTGGKVLDVVKRAEDSEDGENLVEFCRLVRKYGFKAVGTVCEANPSLRIDTTKQRIGETEEQAKQRHMENDKVLVSDIGTNSIISFLNADVDMFNGKFESTLLSMSNQEATAKLQEKLKDIISNEFASDIAKSEAKAKLNYAYVDVDIHVVAKSTMSFKVDSETFKVFNGTKGVMHNFMIKFDGCDKSVPLTEISTPKRIAPKNPFKRPVLKVADIRPVYAMTSYRAQGRTMSDGLIFINCSYLTYEMLYVAVSRARRLSQLRFIYADCEYNDDGVQIAGPKYQKAQTKTHVSTKIDNDLKLGFKVANSSKLMVANTERNVGNLSYDWTNFNWMETIATIDSKYNAAKEESKSRVGPVWNIIAKKTMNEIMAKYFNIKPVVEVKLTKSVSEPKPEVQKPIEFNTDLNAESNDEVIAKFVDLFGLLGYYRCGSNTYTVLDNIPRSAYFNMIGVMQNQGVSIVDQIAVIKAVLDHHSSKHIFGNCVLWRLITGGNLRYSSITIEKWLDKLRWHHSDQDDDIEDDIEMWMDIYQ